jgi:hypothetical protein
MAELSLASLGDYLSPYNTEWAPWPVRMVRGGLSALMLPGDVYSGRQQMRDADGQLSLDAIGRSADLAGLVMGGTFGGAPYGAIGSGPVSRNLRERYRSVLSEASGGKDVQRIKLTPERMSKAAELFKTRFERIGMENPAFGAGGSPYRATQQSRSAIDFAESAKRGGVDDVRVKYPDGPYGSVYVRVGDNGTARFADHLPAIEGGNIVGGYSKTLGRRHYPATVDVSRGRYSDIDPAPAFEWLNNILSK